MAEQVGGSITWDLPQSLEVARDTEVEASIRVVNDTGEEQTYGVGYLFLDTQGYVVSGTWGMVEFTSDSKTGVNAFTLSPGTVFSFGIKIKAPEPDKYFFVLRLHYPREGRFHRDEYVDQVAVFFGKLPAGAELTGLIGPMMSLMVVGMIVPMTRNLGEALKPERREERALVERRRALPPPRR